MHGMHIMQHIIIRSLLLRHVFTQQIHKLLKLTIWAAFTDSKTMVL